MNEWICHIDKIQRNKTTTKETIRQQRLEQAKKTDSLMKMMINVIRRDYLPATEKFNNSDIQYLFLPDTGTGMNNNEVVYMYIPE
jgi:hypothetical protein